MKYSKIIFLAAIMFISTVTGQTTVKHGGPDSRYKTDLLLVVAHPDDESAIGSYLAKLVLDDGKHVSIVYTNRGSGGGNSTGTEQGLSMGLEREIEVRKATAEIGIQHVWFLDGRDTPGQDLFHSLENLKHGTALEKLVRIIRLTRPEVMVTWLPHYVSGENHGDHQASGVLAVEAFNMAGDVTVFPGQVVEPREYYDINNHNEGLIPWQPKKIYFVSDSERPVKGFGPAFDITQMSPSLKIPYYQIAAKMQVHHKTQGDVSDVAVLGLETGNWDPMLDYFSRFHLIFGKSHVGGNSKDDVFAGIQSGIKIPFKQISSKTANHKGNITFEFGGPWSFYDSFLDKHGLSHIFPIIEPQRLVTTGSYAHFPLKISNNTRQDITVTVDRILPENWTDLQEDLIYHVPAGESYPLQTFYFAPQTETEEPDLLKWNLKRDGKLVKTISMKVDVKEWTLPH